MERWKVTALPVIEGEGHVVGVVSTTPAVTIRPDATLPEAARLMTERHIKRLPVVDADGTLRGIVSRADLLKVFLRTDEELATEIRRTVVDRLFPLSHAAVRVSVDQGIATLTGTVRDGNPIPLAERLTRSVEGVVDVHCRLKHPTDATSSWHRHAERPGTATTRTGGAVE
ncbi:CBS domain-containing protein [Streptomyces sp. CMAA1738]|nr:CBS domain-containing protein [Streptomyces sp. CMAA1738]MEC4570865.1 CBS domain-containing protein [Streptomyces sp. CMAA1738]